MSDDLSNRGGQDRSRVSADEPYEVRYFANKHGLSEQQVLDLIKQHGNERQALEAAVERIKGTARV